ncbi:IS481 family transposase [Demequina sp. SYSU T00192]|uniref:IS481 family transposase n=1 Tax=Demequina litoralis TaxID=3051660 RepID=A0ABT8GD85_9MICO|nr:IS481 family transposase [Demequina sp. SYSU T00192]MDN4477012.1 IS481 family transposase [Demequina sp. SYSU T00192]
MHHRNARLTVRGRQILVERIAAGRPVAHVAKEMGVSRTCAHRWWGRYQAEGDAGLEDRSSRPRVSPTRTSVEVVATVVALRENDRLNAVELAAAVGISASTAGRIIARAGLPRLFDIDPISGEVIRASRATTHRYEREHAGDLIHIDVKKVGRIPDGGGHRVHGRTKAARGRGIGYDHVHVAVDDHSRLAFAQVLPDETGDTCAQFLADAAAFFASHGVRVREVMTDNALNYTRARAFGDVVGMLGVKHRRTRPYSPWQNGKAERFNRTLQERWAYRRAYATNADRTAALDEWLDHYNYDRPHTAAGGLPPISRVSPTC